MSNAADVISWDDSSPEANVGPALALCSLPLDLKVL